MRVVDFSEVDEWAFIGSSIATTAERRNTDFGEIGDILTSGWLTPIRLKFALSLIIL